MLIEYLGLYLWTVADVNSSASTCAFEPTPEIAAWLQGAMLENRIRNVNDVAAAVLNSSGLVGLNNCTFVAFQ